MILGSLSEKTNRSIKEYFSYKAYLDANEAFNEWFKHFKSKPSPPEELSGNAQFPEKVAHQHRQSQHKAELERYAKLLCHPFSSKCFESSFKTARQSVLD